MRTNLRLCAAALATSLVIAGPALARREPTQPVPRDNPGNWVTSADYPSDALRDNVEGVTSFALTVDPTGHVSDCQVTATSGSQSLDSTTCDLIRTRAMFTPATGASGKPIEGSYANRVRWAIPGDTEQTRHAGLQTIPGAMTMSYAVSADGITSQCHIEKADGNFGYMRLGDIPCPIRNAAPFHDANGKAIDQRFRMSVSVEALPAK